MGLLKARQLLCQHVRDRDYHADILAGTGYLTIPVQDALMAVHAALSSDALADIAAERQRQISAEGWTAEHDDAHAAGQMADAAACYALYNFPRVMRTRFWPWDAEWWKPKDFRRDLVRAGALIVAEIERLDRAAAKTTT